MNHNKRSTSVNARNQTKSKRAPNLTSPSVYTGAFTSLDDEVTKLSWSKIFQHRAAYAQGNVLEACDPLRSLHFLIEEFCSKIQGHVNLTIGNGIPNTDLDRMLTNIREIMVRIPQNFNSADTKGVCLVCHKLRTKCEDKFAQTSNGKLKPRTKTINRQVQTTNSNGKRANTAVTQVNLFERQFESKVKVIEEKHKYLEDEITQLKDENQRLQNVLTREREELNHLRAEITINEKDYQEEKSKFLKEIFSLAEQIKNMKELEERLDEMKDLKKQINELQLHNKILERELEQANKETIQAQLKYEKMCVIIENREKQLVKLHQEFLNIQELVNSNNHLEQIETSSPSNHHDGIISESWGLISNIPTQDNSINSSHMETTPLPTRSLKRRDRRKSEETVTVCNNTKKFLELPSDISTTSSQITNCSDRYVNHRQK
ncbi:uncharacterized protein LOC123295466 isoform X2 [Chrysoperla carnea]|nr:uncharacterized protein LOC123295466 isoform X2 [Chrysoperla carnea]XP_044732772.1 uncharacterized protein LOC123295466 isoform X2 [Chrysoperla carnea]